MGAPIVATNGRLTLNTLTAVSGTFLDPTTAEAFTRMAAACRAATGVQIDIVNGSGGYRDIESQQILWARRAYYANLRPPIYIAPPGNSTHGLGRALDLTTTCYTAAVERWCRNNCHLYGFTKPPSADPRHFQHNGITLGPITDPAGETTTPITPEPENEATMGVIYAQINGEQTVWCIDRTTSTRRAVSGGEWAIVQYDQPIVGEPIRKLTVIGVSAAALEPFRVVTAAQPATPPTADDGPVLEAIEAARVSINNNIDNQPTTFTVTAQ